MSTQLPVLLVEDDATLREALAETLRLAEYDVVTAADGRAALEALQAGTFSAVVTDYQMRPMDGFALLTAIREIRPHLPVLLITAHGSIEHAVRCMLEGASDYLVKPFAAASLIDRLRQLYPEGRFEVRRFRPNVVVGPTDGQAGFIENEWVGRSLAIGDEVRLRITQPCPRCVMTTIAQDDLPKDPGILRTAARHNDVNVGVYATVERPGRVRRGDEVWLPPS